MYAKIVHINKQAPSDLSCDYFLEKFLYSKAGPFSELILSHAITTAPVLIDFREGRAAKTICSEIEKHNYKVNFKIYKFCFLLKVYKKKVFADDFKDLDKVS